MIDNNYMYKFIEDICKEVGPRESGTEQEILAGNRVELELKNFCDETRQEKYISSPHAFLGGIKYGAIMVFIAGVFYWLTLLIDINVISLNASISTIFLLIAIILNKFDSWLEGLITLEHGVTWCNSTLSRSSTGRASR